MVTAGISVQDIDYVETEGEVIMKNRCYLSIPILLRKLLKLTQRLRLKLDPLPRLNRNRNKVFNASALTVAVRKMEQ